MKLCLLSFRKICLSQFYVHSIQTLSTFLKVVGYIVILADFVNQTGNMYKILLARFIVLNEPVTFRVIEKFYFTSVHDVINCLI